MGINESDFYAQFGSLDSVEAKIWKDMIDATIGVLEADSAFKDFTSQEKILTFYYSLFEELLHNRSYILLQLQSYRRIEVMPSYLREFKKSFDAFFEKTLEEGKVKGEIARRPYFDKRYPQLFWFHLGFILLFWKDDTSAGFEKTDAAIEKSVTLAFDLIGKGAFDSAIDFAKFIYQSRMENP